MISQTAMQCSLFIDLIDSAAAPDLRYRRGRRSVQVFVHVCMSETIKMRVRITLNSSLRRRVAYGPVSLCVARRRK